MKAIDVLRNEGLTVNFARLLVTELGGDAGVIQDNWRWGEILAHYDNLDPAVEWFCLALKDKEAGVRQCAAIALGQIGSIKAVPALCTVLKDEDANVRWRAADALGEIGSVKAVPALTKALKEDKDADVREWAAWALGEIEKKRVNAQPA